ncbi:hypothetical protein P886_1863 [Alteromonadaceae bacterium 2753L.S.0a.02]|nr:hypothetical protein P886_1863 [Alteromonadaceae bacterium 2753L.S.0a.02]
MTDLYDFHFINDQLFNLGSVNSAAELQGVLCGRLCAGESLSDAAWLKAALEYTDLGHLSQREDVEALFSLLLARTQELLADHQYAFQLLLPNDATSLSHRTQELGAWCEGFLHGLGQAIGKSGLSPQQGISKEVSGALKDMAQISQAGVDGDVELDEDENEAYWVELVEYVKVAVLTIYSDIALERAAPLNPSDDSNTLH